MPVSFPRKVSPRPRRRIWTRPLTSAQERGQALIEYVLILALVAIALIAVLTITGPAVGNVFSNAVFNLLGGTVEPRETLGASDFWDMVAAVASYTPEPIDKVRTNTPPPNIQDADSDGIADADDDCPNTPGPISSIPGQNGCPLPDADSDGVPDPQDNCVNDPGPASNNGCPLTDTDGDGIPDLNDDCPLVSGDAAYDGCPPPTPGPSPTPPNTDFGYPFEDPGENKDWWQHDFDQETLKNWSAEFWDLPGSDGASYQPDMTSMPEGSGVWTTTYDTLDYYWTDSPGGGVYKNFYARYQTSVTLEPTEYVMHLRVDDGIRVWVGGTLIVDRWKWVNSSWFEVTFTPTAGVNTIVIEQYDNHTNAYIGAWLESSGNLNQDQGDCNWSLVGEQYHSAPLAWSDSPGSNVTTAANSYCILKLRGNINLSGAGTPKLVFWDRYNLNAITYAKVGIAVAGTDVWDDYVLHANGTNLAWSRQTLDLSNFGDSGTDYRNQTIEIRFIMDARDAGTPGDGWWIDDITVEEEDPNLYQIGFADDMEGALYWVAGGTWSRSSESTHRGNSAWSDSAGTKYANNSTNVLQLDGVIDLTTGTDKPEVIDPEIVFWQKFDLTNTDSIKAEVSTNNRDWTTLMTVTQDTNLTWAQKTISLSSYADQQIYFRFVLISDNSTTADGWWIDDFMIRNHPDAEIQPDWCDNMEIGGGNWVPGGTWAIINGTDDNPAMDYQDPIVRPVKPYDGIMFWSDSPGGNYQHMSDSSLQLLPTLDLTSATNPEIEFWHKWDMAAYDNLYIDVSTDGGDTWASTPWEKLYNKKPAGYGTSGIDQSWYNAQLTWTHEQVSLKTWAGQKINIRFRISALSDTSTSDGWWIDHVCFQEHLDTPIYTLPFVDDFEFSDGNWIRGGTWTRNDTTVTPHQGSFQLSDSDGDYANQTNSILELRGTLDFTGATQPTLYFWDRFSLGWGDATIVEAKTSSDNGATWGLWNQVYWNQYTTTVSWNREQVKIADLANYTGYLVKLRFRLMTSSGNSPGDGWYIDQVSVVDRAGEAVHSVPFFEDGETTNDFWVMDGTWDKIGMSRGTESPFNMGPGGWTAEYYNSSANCYSHKFSDATLVGTRTDADIDFDFDSNRPYGMSNCFMVRWTRQINVPFDDTPLEFQTWSDDGIRVAIDPPTTPDSADNYVDEWAWTINAWVNRGMPSSPDTGGIVLDAGLHTVVVEYYEQSGSADVKMEVVETGVVFTDSPAGNYERYDNASMTLEGFIDLTSPTLTNPVLTYYRRYNLGSAHAAITEVSTDGGFTWSEIKRRTGTQWTWYMEIIDLNKYKGKLINLRFRLDARYNSTPGNGWWIDDIRIFDM